MESNAIAICQTAMYSPLSGLWTLGRWTSLWMTDWIELNVYLFLKSVEYSKQFEHEKYEFQKQEEQQEA